jgi:hypothetical protein
MNEELELDKLVIVSLLKTEMERQYEKQKQFNDCVHCSRVSGHRTSH